MFKKYASLEVKEVIKSRDGFNARQAARKIVEFDPEFVYVAVRAVSADRPNANGDAFPHDELIRIDPILNRPVYASFIQKGVYVNHKNTDDPRYAKGVILDARYVTEAPEGKTASNPDRYVELLLGVDRQKDPVFARDVERGIINKFSMGASVQFTKCSVCENTARRKEEFCDHIAKNKMREVKNAKGEKVLAFERCYGVTYNEISAVSDPADETAQLLARVANKIESSSAVSGEGTSFGKVALLNEMHESIKRLVRQVEAKMKRSAGVKKVAEPAGMAPPMEAPSADEPMANDLGEGLEPVSEENATAVEVLRLVTDMIEGALPPEQAVEQISQLVGEEDQLPPPGEEAGLPEPPAMDMAPKMSAAKKRLAALLERKENKTAKETKMAEEKSKKEKGQYPEYNVQKDPKQYPSKPMKGRPASDFASDAKEYAELWNLSAEFVPSDERTASGWRVLDGEKPLYFVSGGSAFGKHLDSQWSTFASRQYGEALLASILEEGLEQTMSHVNATRIVEESPKQAAKPEAKQAEVSEAEGKVAERLMEAAEAKALELSKDATAEFVSRFVEGLKVAMKLQAKNVLDNPVKAAAWEVLTEAGVDGTLAERVASYEIMDAQVDTLIRKAMEYTEVADETFAEIQAHAESMPYTKVAAENPEAEEEAIRAALRSRASKPTLRTARKGLAPEAWLSEGSEEDSDPLRRAVRAGRSQRVNVPTRGLK